MIHDDLFHALRRLRSRPTVMVMGAAMLALGIGLTTAMFTLVDALVLRPAPFRDIERLTGLDMFTQMKDGASGRTVFLPATIAGWRSSPAFDAVEGASTTTSLNRAGHVHPDERRRERPDGLPAGDDRRMAVESRV